MKDYANLVRSASSTLLHSGYAIVRMGPLMQACLDEAFDEADAFFAKEPSEKTRFARPDILEGFRTFGAEFSGDETRPDLNETFSLVLRNQSRPDIAVWRAVNPLHNALRRAAPVYASLANAVLDDIRNAFDPEGDRIDAAAFSYLQLNYYRPGRENRDLLQDAHEDGHLLTVVTSRQPGLEIEVDGRFEPANIGRDELLIMPGSILTLMTGGHLRPLVHRVRNVSGVRTRASLMFFVNASVTTPTRAWAPAEDGSYPDIRAATIESSQVFGLTSIEALAR
ncbi:2OG-Fe(II) oxygenase family protein [Methylopila sp. M107]|uniref:2OG-Fe(II) oxygenase family protein n=1 Tax=Methylopila sp. M107 TaxID=1101190 RepID=UPI0003774837|nr:2OG-Fe(II) oxygenase family protein [Methylopila sp. M107]